MDVWFCWSGAWWKPGAAPNGSTPNVHAQIHPGVGYGIYFNSSIPGNMYVHIRVYIHISLYFPMGPTLNPKKICKYVFWTIVKCFLWLSSGLIQGGSPKVIIFGCILSFICEISVRQVCPEVAKWTWWLQSTCSFVCIDMMRKWIGKTGWSRSCIVKIKF